MVIETRPDCITPREVVRLRRYGVTKVQMGIQSLDDAILERNKRGHDVEEIRSAFRLLRAAGFKIHVHWMPNLLGATPESDLEDFAKIWDDHCFRPDELKLYPCMVVAGSELYDLWKKGEYTPYSTETLIDLLAQCKKRVPPYCRITRVMRDIPSSDIIAGCSYSNLRQMVREYMHTSGNACGCIRCREVRRESVEQDSLVFRTTRFETDGTEEYFIAAEERDVRPGRPHPLLAGFLRLSLPTRNEEALLAIIPELRNVAMVREVHVYGPSLALGSHEGGRAQHIGLGTELLNRAEETAKACGFRRIAVISAIGTRGYYRKRGYVDGEFYLHKDI
jgi:elongator complex protein 3